MVNGPLQAHGPTDKTEGEHIKEILAFKKYNMIKWDFRSP